MRARRPLRALYASLPEPPSREGGLPHVVHQGCTSWIFGNFAPFGLRFKSSSKFLVQIKLNKGSHHPGAATDPEAPGACIKYDRMGRDQCVDGSPVADW